MKGIAQVVVSRITMAAPGMSECGMRMGTRSILQLSAWPVLMELRGLVGSLTLLPSCSHSAHHHGASGEASLHAGEPLLLLWAWDCGSQLGTDPALPLQRIRVLHAPLQVLLCGGL